jgi:hypothetical protein
MAKLARRGFLKQTSASVATIGVLATIPGLAMAPDMPEVAAPDLSELSATLMNNPVVAHISDPATGEISLLVGTQEIIYRDPDLVMRLLKAAL